MTKYELPDVWQWEEENSNRGGNRPTAGERFEQKLPVGEAPFQLYSLGTPNGIKVTIMLEELKELGAKVQTMICIKSILEPAINLVQILSRSILILRSQP